VCAAWTLVVAAIAGHQQWDDHTLAVGGVSTDATVVAVAEDGYYGGPIGGNISATSVTVAFTDATGAHRQAEHHGRASTKVGDRFRVTYDPQDPTRVTWDSATDRALLDWWIAAAMGTYALLCAAAWRRRHRRPQPTQPEP
jgi:hypothetical protein